MHTGSVPINCEGNRLKALDVSKNINLEGLGCDYNFISEVDLSNNENMGYYDPEQLRWTKTLKVKPIDKVISVGKKVRFKSKNKIKNVLCRTYDALYDEFIDDSKIVSYKLKGKKIIITGKETGMVIISNYAKGGYYYNNLLNEWVIAVD